MTIFREYAATYDDLYHDKDYSAECDFLESVFRRYGSGAVRSVLDVGCGTGGHATILASRGYRVHAVDRSPEMLRVAHSRPIPEGAAFELGDLRDYDSEKPVDAVVAMFAVMSYMTTNADIEKAFRTAATHLEPGGLFVFDSWFGPAVFSSPPQEKIKDVAIDDRRVIRLTRPQLDVMSQIVTVRFKLLTFRGNRFEQEFDEVHEIRPLFCQEVAHFGQLAGLEMIDTCAFMHIEEPLTIDTWNSCFILRRT